MGNPLDTDVMMGAQASKIQKEKSLIQEVTNSYEAVSELCEEFDILNEYASAGDHESVIEAVESFEKLQAAIIELEQKSLLSEEMDPNNAELQYNLGVIAAEADHPDEAKGYYEKAIALDPTYINAYINLSALILGGEQPLIEEMNGLGTSSADNKRYDELREQRQALYRDAIPYLDKALEIAPKNINAAKTLMNIYSILGETDKYKAMKERVESIEGTE